MKLLIEAHHPAHIHFFKNAVRIWRQRGDEVLMLARDRDVMRQLLEAYDWIPSRLATSTRRSNRFPLREMLRRQLAVSAAIVRFRPDVVLSLMGSYTQSARLFGVPNLVFTDSEFQHFNHRIAHPFATTIYTPECFDKPLGPRQKKYRGYHELSFLHPDRYRPDPAVVGRLRGNRNLENGREKPSPGPEPFDYVVVRTSAWNTLHDIGQSGLGPSLDDLLSRLLRRHHVYVVPEGGRVDPKWARLKLSVPPHCYHDVLAFARLVVTEGASTASEAACLGVPSVYVNSTHRGYLDDQERRYGLVFNHRRAEPALAKVHELLDAPPARSDLEAARERLVADHIDVTRFMVEEVDRTVLAR